jgi:hypothetical protein
LVHDGAFAFGVNPPMVKNCTLRKQARLAGPEGTQLAVSEASILSSSGSRRSS